MTRKLLALLLAMVMLLSFAACDITLPNLPFFGNDPTEPPATEPPATEPPATEPPATEPPATEPPATEPPATEPKVYLNLTESHLNAIGKVNADNFNDQMNANWNFGWHGDATLETNATKIDFSYGVAESELIWRLGTYGAEGAAQHINAGWGAGLWVKGEGNVSYMYNKVDIHEYATQFRVWAVSNTDNHWSGSGAVRAVALYKDAEGNWVEHVFTPIADTFTTGEATFNAEKGTVEFANGVWSMPGTLDGCMIIYDMADLAGKEDVVIVVESVGLGTILGDEYTEAAEGVPAGEVMPESVIVKRIMFVVEPPAPPVDPDATQPTTPAIPVDQEVYLGMTGNDLDALAGIKGDAFGAAMNEGWNIGWHDTSLEGTAGKIDFDGTAADSTKWHLGTVGTGAFLNGGWCVLLQPTGAGSNAYMYNKIDVPAEGLSQFRIWAGADGTAAAIRAVACYKNEDGTYTREVLVPVGEAANFYNAEDGTVRITGTGWTADGIGDGMMIYGMGNLAGKEGVTIFIEVLGLEDGVTNSACIKRIIFC